MFIFNNSNYHLNVLTRKDDGSYAIKFDDGDYDGNSVIDYLLNTPEIEQNNNLYLLAFS